VTKLNQGHLSEDDVVFMITPRINAASRMGVSDVAFKLLVSQDKEEAKKIAKELHETNEKRKAYVASIVKAARKKIDARNSLPDVIVIGDIGWSPGLVGLVAQALVEHYGRIVFVWGSNGEASALEKAGEIKGSCRGVGSVDLVKLMGGLPEGILTESGGHKNSGGFSTTKERVHFLEEKLNEVHKGVVSKNTEDEKIQIDLEIPISEVTWETHSHIEQLAPFGMGNPKPTFLFKDLEVSAVKSFGKESAHIDLSFSGSDIEAIGFFMTPDSFENKPEEGKKINLLATIEKSAFRGRPELRLRIVDIL